MNYRITTKLAGADFPLPPAPASRALIPSNFNRSTDGQTSWNLPTILDSGMLFRDVGSSGLRQYAGWVREEFLPQLAGRQAARAYREMLDNSSAVGSVMLALNSSMRRVAWRVEPSDEGGDASEQAEFIEGCMDDMSHTWSDFVIESLSMLGYGFAPHEIVYKRSLGRRPGRDPDSPLNEELPRSRYDDGKIRWRRLPIRGQETVLKWFFGPGGSIRGMTQQPWNGPIVSMPIEKMLLFRASTHKNNPEGKSILRNAYRSWYFVKRLEELEAILFERMGGIPVVSVPKALLDAAYNGDAHAVAELETWKRIATNVRIDEQMGMVLPSDRWMGANGPSPEAMYSFELATPQGGRGQAVDSDKAIARYNINIVTSVLADFVTMGHDTRGAQNLGETKMDMFMQAAEGFLKANADVLNRHGVPRLMDLNGYDPDGNPNIHPDMPQRTDLDVLSNFVLRMSQAGMPLFPNETLEEYILDAAGMPDVVQDEGRQLLVGQQQEKDQLALDMQRQLAEGNDDPQAPEGAPPVARTKLQRAIAASLARRIRKHGGAAEPVRKRGQRRRR